MYASGIAPAIRLGTGGQKQTIRNAHPFLGRAILTILAICLYLAEMLSAASPCSVFASQQAFNV